MITSGALEAEEVVKGDDELEPLTTGTGWARQRQRLQDKAKRDFQAFLDKQRANDS